MDIITEIIARFAKFIHFRDNSPDFSRQGRSSSTQMNLHEYQAKRLFSEYGIRVSEGMPLSSAEEAYDACRQLGGESWIVKAQVHAGGRGKGGGVRRAGSPEEVYALANEMLGTQLITPQTGEDGLPVNVLLVERPCAIERELYLGLIVDRGRERVVFMASSEGGMEIEEVAARDPDKILTVAVDPVAGLQPYQCRQIGFGLGLEAGQIKALSGMMQGLYRLYTGIDASLVEINPLVVDSAGELLALDAKLNLDDNALFRHPALAELRDSTQEDAREHAARQHDLNYVSLDGDIGCMVNGAGLAMATMDLIKLQGGEPANFLDVGGGTTAERVAEAFKLIVSDPKVKAILVNIFGGIVRCDLIAEGIIQAVQEVGVRVPVVVRLEGTNVERGRELLQQSGLAIETAVDLNNAAQQVVQAARS